MSIDRYAVVGNPISHSKSPIIHKIFAKQTHQSIQYDAILIEPSQFAKEVKAFFSAGGKGLNVTVPFKQDAWKIADKVSEQAQLANAVNTLLIDDDGTLIAENTDGTGLVRDLNNNLALSLHNKSVLLLGAGGAARGVLQPLLEQNPASLLIANRTPSRAQALAKSHVDLGQVTSCGFSELPNRPFDVIINATSAGLNNDTPPLPANTIHSESFCYDLMYASEPTAFVRYAKQQGATQTYDGLGMLVEQAAESFRLWRGVTPDTAPVIAALRAH